MKRITFTDSEIELLLEILKGGVGILEKNSNEEIELRRLIFIIERD